MTADTTAFWAGTFGNEYAKRNTGLVESNVVLFSRIMSMTDGVGSVVEFGCGTGQNLQALHILMPHLSLVGVEINEGAAKRCKVGEIHHRSILDPELDLQADMAITKGVLIHQHPDDLPTIYSRLHATARRYILVAEYYNPTSVEVEYRGHTGTLWQRVFAGELLDRFDDLNLVDYGFTYHRGPFPQDDITWFLLEKKA